MKKELRQIIQKLHTDQLVLNYGSKVTAAKPIDLIRVISEWSQKDILDLSIRNIMIDAILSSENKQIGSGIICVYSMLQRKPSELLKESIKKHRPEKNDLTRALRYFLGVGTIYRLCETLLEMGGMSSTIRFDLGNHNDFIVRQVDTHEIFGTVHPLFGSCPSSIDSPVILAIDGIIESLGEIDFLLQRAAEIKCPIILCAMGFGPDVVNTLAHNWKANRLRVLPFWIHKLNPDQSLLEICEKIKVTCVTSERGDVINTTELDECTRVQAAFLSAQSLSIQGESGDGNHLEISLPHKLKGLAGVIEDRCRASLEICVGITKTGRPDIVFFQEAISKLNMPLPIVSCSSLEVGIKSAISCEKIIDDLGGIIISQ